MHIHGYFNSFSSSHWGRMAMRAAGIVGLGAVLASCATGPKPVRSLGVYAIESVAVTSSSNNALFANGLQSQLEAQIVGDGGVGVKARLFVNVVNLRYKSANRTIFTSRSSVSAINVVLKSSASGLTLRNFSLSARSAADDQAVARDEMAQSLTRQLAQIFPIIMPVTPQVAVRAAPQKINIVKKAVAPTPKPKPKPRVDAAPRVVEFNQFPERTEPAPIEVSVQPKPALIPVASASPDVAVDSAPLTPSTTPPAPITVIEAPVVEKTPVVEAAPPVSAAPSSDDELCVVTLENDCSDL